MHIKCTNTFNPHKNPLGIGLLSSFHRLKDELRSEMPDQGHQLAVGSQS